MEAVVILFLLFLTLFHNLHFLLNTRS